LSSQKLQNRVFSLDCLRGVAILLVLFTHADNYFGLLGKFGWLGVDLFFVLSGYLISNKVFRQIKSGKEFKFFSFFISRLLRIVPVFITFLIVGYILYYFKMEHWPYWKYIISEVFFIQNYNAGLFVFLWSLDAEMHFYFLFGLSVLIFQKVLSWSNIQYLIVFFFIVWISLFVIRYIDTLGFPDKINYVFRTHYRCDGFFVGIFGSFFRLKYSFDFFKKYKWIWLVVFSLLISSGFIFGAGTFEMNCFGMTAVNLGFGVLLMLALEWKPDVKVRLMLTPISRIGVVSYSIYIWHLIVREYTFKWINDRDLENWLFVVLSIIIGYVLYLLIEKPLLNIRRKIMRKMFGISPKSMGSNESKLNLFFK